MRRLLKVIGKLLHEFGGGSYVGGLFGTPFSGFDDPFVGHRCGEGWVVVETLFFIGPYRLAAVALGVLVQLRQRVVVVICIGRCVRVHLFIAALDAKLAEDGCGCQLLSNF